MKLTKANLEIAALCSTDESRPIINNLHITTGYTEATNGHMLARVTLLPDDDKQLTSILLHPQQVKKLMKLIPKACKYAKVDIKETTLTASVKDSTLQVECSSGQFPNTGDVIPKLNKDTITVRVDTMYLYKVATILKGYGKVDIEVDLSAPHSPMVFKAQNEDGQYITALILPMRRQPS